MTIHMAVCARIIIFTRLIKSQHILLAQTRAYADTTKRA